MTLWAIILPPEGVITELDHKPGDRELNEAVGGYFETVELSSGQIGWINEEGKILGLPNNPRATALSRLYVGDNIVGPMVITGPSDGRGEITRIDSEFAQVLRDLTNLLTRNG